MPAPTEIARSVEVAAPPEQVWALVSDLPRMGELSRENTGGAWTGGATGPAVGARFRGTNAQGGRSWSTLATVVRCEPDRSFAFDVRATGLRVARWSYELEQTPTGCRVTETWTDQRGRLITAIGRRVTGVPDRLAHVGPEIEHTLAALKAHLEQAGS